MKYTIKWTYNKKRVIMVFSSVAKIGGFKKIKPSIKVVDPLIDLYEISHMHPI